MSRRRPTLSEDERRQIEHRIDENVFGLARQILAVRYGLWDEEAHTIEETADIMGVSKSYISRLCSEWGMDLGGN